MELWDLIDQDRKPLGLLHEKGKPIPQKAYHLVVHVCVFNDNDELLIQRRAKDRPVWPEFWDVSASGSALASESSRQAAQRELFEEIGLLLDFKEAQPYLSVHGTDWISDWYLVECCAEIDTLVLQKEEVSDIKWASLDQILQMKKQAEFIDYHEGFLELLFHMRKKRGALQ